MIPKEWHAFSSKFYFDLDRFEHTFKADLRHLFNNLENAWTIYISSYSLYCNVPTKANRIKMEANSRMFEFQFKHFNQFYLKIKLMSSK